MDESKIVLNEADKASFLTVYESAMSREERHSKRTLNVLIFVLVLWFSTVIAFVWYVTLPVDEISTEYSQEVEDIDSSSITQNIGDTNGQSETDSQNDIPKASHKIPFIQ